MEDQTQSSLVTSSKGTEANVDPSPGAAAKGSSGVSLERSVRPPTLPSAPPLSSASTSEPVGTLSPSPVSSPPWTKATETPDVVLDRGPSSALVHPSKEAALSNTEKELLGAAVIRGMSDLQRAGNGPAMGAPLAGPEPGSVFENYSWMSQPGLIFKKEEDPLVTAEARTHHQVELATGRDQATGESAKSDPSSIDSSQEEDSLERLTPDSPFEVLAEVQEKGSCEEARLKPSPASKERQAALQEPKKSFFFTGAIDKGPSGGSKLGTRAEGGNGPGAEDEKPSSLLDHRSPDQPRVQEEDPGIGGKPRKGEHARPSAEVEGVESSTMEVVLEGFQPTLAGSTAVLTEAFAPGLQDKGKSILGLDVTLDQGPSDVEAEPMTIPTTGAQSLGEVCTVQPAQPIMDKHVVSLAQPADAKTDANAPSPERPSGGPIDDFLVLEEESKTLPSSPHETAQVIKEPVSGQCVPRAPTVQTAAALDRVQPEPLEVDSSGESEDTVIEDLKGPPGQQPLAQKVATEQQLPSSYGGLQNLVLVPVINVTEIAQEQGVSDGEEAAVSHVTSGARETRCQPGDAKDSQVEDQVGFGKASKVEEQVGFGKASKVEDQRGFTEASKVEDQVGFTETSKVEDLVGFGKTSKVEEQVGFGKASKVEDQSGFTEASKVEDLVGFGKDSKVEDLVGFGKASKVEDLVGFGKDSKVEDLVGFGKASKVEDQVGFGKDSKVEDLVGFGKASKVEDLVGFGKASKVEDLVGFGKDSKVEDLVGFGKASKVEDLVGFTEASKVEDQRGFTEASKVEDLVGFTEASKVEDHVGFGKDSQVEDLVGFGKASKVEDQVGFTEASKVEDLVGFGKASKVEDQVGFTEASKVEDQVGFTKASKVEDLVGFGKASKVEDQVGFGKASKVEDLVGFGKASKVEDQVGFTKTSKVEDLVGFGKASKVEDHVGFTEASKVEDLVGFGKASKVEDQVGFTEASKVEDLVGFTEASKVEDRAEVPGGLPEGQAKGEAAGLIHGGIEPSEVSPPLTVGDHPSEDRQPAAEGAGRHGPGASPVSSPVPPLLESPVPEKSAPLPSSSPDFRPLAETRDSAVCLGGMEPGDPSAPLLEMIRRSEIQRGQLAREKQAVPVPPAPEPVPTQSVIVTSTPVVVETPSIVVKPLKPPDDKPSDLPVEDEIGPLSGAPSRPSPQPEPAGVPDGAGGPPSGTVQESEEGGAIPGGSIPALEEQRSPPPPPRDQAEPAARTPTLPLAPADSGAEQRDREPPEAVIGGEDAERRSQATVKDLIYWSDPKKTGVVFGSTLTLLVSLAVFSVVSVLAYLVLALLSVTISFRVYKSVIQAVQKVNDGNPFKVYLEQDITLSADTFRKYCDTTLVHVNRALKYLLQLFLVQDLVDSLKLAVLMWLMTYVGAVFNGLTLLILAVLLTFSVPAVYKKYQKEIDHYVDLVQKQVCCAVGKIQEKLPGTKRKNE
ncbi:LOW QUALITY PROTEIN: uncharacterized protein LOC127586946 [Pristis pectinata]|uniref:LOW QUALITY PROTEIN: uncharacterized protein LOC127586946 n=1 Tax=Pristis pectinata TaxID=685728 RepID=UPI00223E2C7B|nr:LOW QUALITY PROTEIN: uncharacterized protein LOC127586946 [Pristis pectinata]